MSDTSLNDILELIKEDPAGRDMINRFGFHPATEETKELHKAVRQTYLTVAIALVKGLPQGREASLALTALQESMMWANAAIACNLAPVDESELTDLF